MSKKNHKSYSVGKEKDLHITGGKFNGSLIKTPNNTSTHPMGSRERLALFNVLTSLKGPMEGYEVVLDAYCGSGALGIEALSRGARIAVFIDNDWDAGEIAQENLAKLNLEDVATVADGDIAKVHGLAFDLIFADPPYDNFPSSLENLAEMLNEGGFLILSHPSSVEPEKFFKSLKLQTTKSYARANLSFYTK